MGNADQGYVGDLSDRVPGHALIDELLRQWDAGRIRLDEQSGFVTIDDEALGWYWGVLGERRVAAQLATLSPEWTVLHSVPVGSGMSDIDHIAIGPGGVFTINTKYCVGRRVWVANASLHLNGRPTRFVHAARHEAQRASSFLSRAAGMPTPVTSVLAFVDPMSITVKEPPSTPDVKVLVVSDADLVTALRSRQVLDAESLAAITTAALQPETWHRSLPPSSIGTHIEREFVALESALAPRPATTVGGKPTRSPSRNPRTRSAARSRPSGRSSRSRRRRSRLQRDLLSLAMSVVGLLVLWHWVNSIVS